MDLKYIKKLSDRYWHADTTVEEENQLRQTLSSDDTMLDQREVDYFNTIESFSSLELDDAFGREVMSKIHKSQKQVRLFQKDWFKLAATIVLAGSLGLGIWFNSNNAPVLPLEDDPRQAFELTKQALMMVSVRLNKGKDYTVNGLSKMEETRLKISQQSIVNSLH